MLSAICKYLIDETKLIKLEKVCIEFALSGIIAVLDSEEIVENPLLLMEVIKKDIVKVSFGSLQ